MTPLLALILLFALGLATSVFAPVHAIRAAGLVLATACMYIAIGWVLVAALT